MLNYFQDWYHSLPIEKRKSYILRIIAIIIIFIILLILIVTLSYHFHSNNNEPPHLFNMININNIMEHLIIFQNIANEYNGSRTAITGYNSSVKYVMDQLLKNTNYNVTLQYFNFPFFRELKNPILKQILPQNISYIFKFDFQNLRNGGSGNITSSLYYVQGGCLNSNYDNFTKNSIVLMDRGFLKDCNMNTKIEMAYNHSAIGVIILNDPGSVGLFSAGLTFQAPFPTFSVTYNLGQQLIQLSKKNTLFTMFSLNEAPETTTMNIIADSLVGNSNNIIVVGSHLDSVLAGPGINDNGSGSGTNLELAIQFYNLISKYSNVDISNKIRFCWWGAEEFGLIGSKYYVNSLSIEEKEKILLNLNFDMLGSPNFFRGVYHGSSSSPNIRNISTLIQNLFEDFFIQNNLYYDLTPFTGRSDYGPFIEVGIPAGGLASGAEVLKTVQQRNYYGGLANTAYDPCYHLSCDTIENINENILSNLSRAAAYTLEKLATNKNLR